MRPPLKIGRFLLGLLITPLLLVGCGDPAGLFSKALELLDPDSGAGFAGYITVGFGGTISWSSDGDTWVSPSSVPGSDDLYDVAYGGGAMIAVGSGGAIWLSEDAGTTWQDVDTGLPIQATLTLTGVAYGNGRFVAVGYDGSSNGYGLTTADLTSWAVSAVQAGAPFTDVGFGTSYNKFIAVTGTASDEAYITANGTVWTSGAYANALHRAVSIYASPTKFFAVGMNQAVAGEPGISWSSDGGASWATSSLTGATADLTGVGFDPVAARYVTVSTNGAVYRDDPGSADDGHSWQYAGNSSVLDMNAVAGYAGVWVSVDEAGNAWRSIDVGSTWSLVATAPASLGNPLKAVIHVQ